MVRNKILLAIATISSLWLADAQNPLPDDGVQLTDIENGFNMTKTSNNFTIQTSYKFDHCSPDQQKALKTAVADANTLAFAGIKVIARQGAGPLWFIDFSHQAAIDYFGPKSKNGDEQNKIIQTLEAATYAYPGWGLSDWWSDRYVQLSCNASLEGACPERALAATSNKIKDFGYPLITFCPPYFKDLKTLGEVLKTVDANKKNERLNVFNLRSQASTMLHEWLHMNWGAAQVCPGGSKDFRRTIGPKKEKIKIYKAGPAKMLANLDVHTSAMNNDNYVYYSMAWFMLRRYGNYPQYPSAWNPNYDVKSNQNRMENEPGYPTPNPAIDDSYEVDMDEPDGGPEVTDTPYPASDYDDWYQPVISAISLEPTSSSATLPTVSPPPGEGDIPSTSSSTSTSSSATAAPAPPFPSPSCMPAADGGFDVNQAYTALGDFCSQTAKVQAGAAPISKVYAAGEGPGHPIMIRYTLSWNDKGGCPTNLSPSQNAGRDCNTIFHDIINGCPESNPSLQSGGSLTWWCGYWALDFDSGQPDVAPPSSK